MNVDMNGGHLPSAPMHGTGTTEAPQAGPTGALRKNAISLPGATAMGIAFIAPAAGMAFLPQIVAGQAGASVPLIYTVALLGCLAVAYTIAQFAKAISSAGSFYTFNAKGLGTSAGFVSGWLLIIGYLVAFPQNMLAFAYSLQSVISAHLGINIPWWIFAGLGTIGITAIALRGLGVSVKVDLTLIGIEVVILAILAVVIIERGGAEGNTLAVFSPQPTGHVSSGLLFGLVFAFLTLVGFEASATVAEETRDARRNIPRAMLMAVAASGIFFIFITYAITIGFGIHHADALANSALPLDTLAQRYIGGGFAVAVDVAVIVSAFAVALAAGNGLVRVLFAMSRDGMLPARLAHVHPRRHVPSVAIVAVGVLSLVIELGLGGAFGPYPEAYSYLGAVGGLPVLVLYMMVAVSLFIYIIRERRNEFNFFKHALIPFIGFVIAGTAIYGSYSPLPQGVFLYINLGVVVYAIVGIVVAVWLKRRGSTAMSKMADIVDA